MAEKNVNEFKGIRIETIQKGNTEEKKKKNLYGRKYCRVTFHSHH